MQKDQAKQENHVHVVAMSEAVSYERKSEGQRGVGIKLMDLISTNIFKGATILDLGCGTGYLTKVLSERVGPEGKVVAVDPDGDRVKLQERSTLPATLNISKLTIRHFHQDSMT